MDWNVWVSSLYLEERNQSEDVVVKSFDERLRYWRRLFGKDPERLEECLREVSAINMKKLEVFAASKGVPSQSAMQAEWVTHLKTFLSKPDDTIVLPFVGNVQDGKATVPFSSFFEPFLKLAYGKLQKPLSMLSEETVRAALINLTEILFEVSHRTLILELNVARVSGKLSGETSEARFRYFSETLLKDKHYLRQLYEEYPVLTRLLLTKTAYWVDHVSEVLQRVEADRALLSENFHDGRELGALKTIRLGMGDAHNRGRGVVLLTFDSGVSIVYKPRSLAMDIRFQELLQWLNRHMSEAESLYILNAVDRGSYGWVEFIDRKSCESEAEVSRFYRRIGKQLALLYVLNAVDFHYENLIAHGEFPVLIDLESFFHQTLTKTELTERAVDRATALLQRSVQSTGILPAPLYYQGDPKARGIDVSGLGGGNEQKTPFKVPTISQKNTDQMKIVQDYASMKGENNRPRLQDHEVDASEYIADLESGFRKMYKWLMDNKASFKKHLRRFADVKVRTIVRSTHFYGELLRQSWHPDFLRDGLDRDLLLHRLWLDTELHPGLKKVVRWEKRDLLDGDIPYFFTRPGQPHLWDGRGNCLPDCFSNTALDEVNRKIDNLNPTDCHEQLQVLHMSLLANDAKHYADIAPIAPRPDEPLHAADRKACLQEAERIGKYLLSKAISGNDEGKEDLSWISTTLEGNAEILWQIAPVGDDLYNGNAGIALFLGYLSFLTGQEAFREAAEKAMVSVRRKLREFPDNPTWSVGVFSGAGGYLYAMDHLSFLWSDDSMTEELLDSLPWFIRMIPHDQVFDYIGGSAGALSVLLGIYRRTGNIQALEGARRCADHLLENATEVGEGIGWKPPWESQPLTGFSHGTAGIAAVLAQLYAITKDSRLREAVQGTLSYERTFFASEAGNWRTPGRDNLSVAWCHGAPGILLGRLILKQSGYEDEWLDREIEIALKTTVEQGFGNNRSLCHGDFGQIDILRFAAEVLKDKRCEWWADSAARQVLRHIRKKGFDTGVSRGVEAAGLMIGLAGFGFGFLSQYAPSTIPSVLQLADTQTIATPS